MSTTIKREFSDIKFNDRYGYAIAYYGKNHMKDPALEIIERSKRINLPTRRRTKVIQIKSLAEKESPAEFIHRKQVEMEIEILHDKYEKAKESFRRTRDLNYNRQKVLYPHYKNTIEGEKVDKIFEKVANCYEKHSGKIEESQQDEEDEKSSQKPLSVVKDRHSNYQILIEKRRKEALHDVDMYYDSLSKINNRIKSLNKAFNESED